MPLPTSIPIEVTFEHRLRCVEIAERSVYYSTRPHTAGSGISLSTIEDKSLREIFDRADRIAQYCLNSEPPANLIERLRDALCPKD